MKQSAAIQTDTWAHTRGESRSGTSEEAMAMAPAMLSDEEKIDILADDPKSHQANSILEDLRSTWWPPLAARFPTIRDEGSLEDLLQIAAARLLEVVRKPHIRANMRGCFTPYTTRLCFNVAFDWLRKNKPNQPVSFDDETVADTAPSRAQEMVDACEAKIARERAQETLARFERLRGREALDTLERYLRDDLETQSARTAARHGFAAILGISYDALRQRVSRWRQDFKDIREQLDRELGARP